MRHADAPLAGHLAEAVVVGAFERGVVEELSKPASVEDDPGRERDGQADDSGWREAGGAPSAMYASGTSTRPNDVRDVPSVAMKL